MQKKELEAVAASPLQPALSAAEWFPFLFPDQQQQQQQQEQQEQQEKQELEQQEQQEISREREEHWTKQKS